MKQYTEKEIIEIVLQRIKDKPKKEEESRKKWIKWQEKND